MRTKARAGASRVGKPARPAPDAVSRVNRMTVRLAAVCFDVAEPVRSAGFWAELLGRAVTTEAGGACLLRGDHTQVALRFAPAADAAAARQRRRIHLHVTSASRADQLATVARAIALGGRSLDETPPPEGEHMEVRGPGDVDLCVIEPDNGYLAGTGLLGEVACVGSHTVGLFWRDALGWPLVWDRDGETAVQSPAGGTKVAWGGQSPTPRTTRSRERFDLEADDVRAEVERLVGLGAVRLGDRDGVVVLADPDGNDVTLASA